MNVKTVVVLAFLASCAFMFAMISQIGRSDHKAEPQDIEWFTEATGVRFPDTAHFAVFDRQDFFVGSGGGCDLKVRMPASSLGGFANQAAFAKAEWSSTSNRVPDKEWLPEWRPSRLYASWSSCIDLAGGKELRVTIGEVSPTDVEIYLDLLY